MLRSAILGVLFAACVSGLGLAQQQPVGKKVAVLVGVKRYNNVNFESLHFTENDVVELGKLLKPQGFDVTVLSDGQEGDRLPTRENILSHLDRVLKKREREDTVVFGFAGHGLQFEGDRTSYFLPRDAEPGDSTTMVSLQTVYDKLENCGAGVKLMFVDACRNHSKKVRGRSAFDDQTPPPPRGVCALFSCSAGQLAFEDSALKHGIFFYHVLEGLRGKAKHSSKNLVTVLGLADYATDAVEASGHKQRPVLKGETTNGVLVTLGNKNDQDAIQGTWTIKAVKAGSPGLPESLFLENKLVFEGDLMSFVKADGTQQKSFRFKLDPSKKPAVIEMAATEGKSKGQVGNAVYELHGDELKVCMPGGPDQPAPTSLLPAEYEILFHLKRATK